MNSPHPPVQIDGLTYHWFQYGGGQKSQPYDGWYLAQTENGDELANIHHSEDMFCGAKALYPCWEVLAWAPCPEVKWGSKVYVSGNLIPAQLDGGVAGLAEAMAWAVTFYLRSRKNMDNFRKLPSFQKWVQRANA